MNLRKLTDNYGRRVLEKAQKRIIEYWKKHNPKKYKEIMRYIKMVEGKVV